MGYIGEFDQAVLNIVERLPAVLHPFMVFITTIGSPLYCMIILLVIVSYGYVRKNKLFLISGTLVLLAMPLSIILKDLTKRIRPDTPYVQNMLFRTYSFPSGHAYSSFLVFGLLAYLAYRVMQSAWKWPLIVTLVTLVFLVGLSRIYLGAHFPSDVVGGWILASAVLLLTIKLFSGRDA
ncbi:MAG TPA: phosphatase PAP2 family protein [Candidatus Limnocylindrales bacterium]|nr:phosphatase PAP2 family protein [Candidatus Limnocylindrales bacterium]